MTQGRAIRFRIPILIVLLCLAGILRVAYLDFGLPRWPDSAETEMQTGGSIGILLAALGASPRHEAEQAGDWIVEPGHSSGNIKYGRLLGAILGCASVFLVWVIAGKLYGQSAALVAAALLAVHPQASFSSRFALRETAVGLLWLLGFLLVIRSSQKRARLGFFLAGFLLVAGSLAGALAVLLWTALLFTMNSSPPDFARISLFILVLGFALFVFDGPILLAISLCIVAISGLFLHFSGRKTRRPLQSPNVTNSHWATYGATAAILSCFFLGAKLGPGSGGFDALYTAAAPRLFDFGTMPMLIAASVGLGWAVVRAQGKDVPWLGYGILALLVGFCARNHTSLWGVASIPVLCVFAAAGVEGFSRILRSSFKPLAKSRRLASTLILVILALSIAKSVGSVEKLSRKPTLEAAVEWLQRNAPQGARIAVESGSLILPSGQFDMMQINSASDNSPQFYRDQGVRFIVVSGFNVLGAQKDVSLGPVGAVGYAKLLSSAKGSATFGTSAALIGPMIIVIAI